MITLLSIQFHSKNPRLDIFDAGLPEASDIFSDGNKHIITWCIRGYFSTKDNTKYFNDIREKIYIFLNGSPARATYLKEYARDKEAYVTLQHTDFKVYDLKELSHIEDMRYYKSSRIVYKNNGNTDDKVFDALRYEAYRLFKLGVLTEERLYQVLLDVSSNPKKHQAKVMQVYQWVTSKYVGKQIKADTITRAANATIQAQARSDVKYRAAVKYFESLQAFNITESISEMATGMKVTWRTAKKYFLRWLDNRVKDARNKAMLFIQHIRANTLAPVAAAITDIFQYSIKDTIKYSWSCISPRPKRVDMRIFINE